MSSRTSEILLLILLFVIIGFTRIYYGVPESPMFVWKDHFTYKDTLVNLAEFEKMPRADIEKDHPGVLFQLQAMGLIDDVQALPMRRRHRQPNAPQPLPVPADSGNSAPTPSANH